MKKSLIPIDNFSQTDEGVLKGIIQKVLDENNNDRDFAFYASCTKDIFICQNCTEEEARKAIQEYFNTAEKSNFEFYTQDRELLKLYP
ncbi:MAG: hypothetical protein ACFFB5_24765 [Promethearchaeota archaeon]